MRKAGAEGLSAADEAVTYALKRSENNGYVSYKNDTSIIDGIANVFPVFFILIALLVFITTMTRMVEEERTQIGTLKALGCSDFSITMKYMLYAGSAALIGWVIGFFAGTWGLPGGWLFTRFVLSRVLLDNLTFPFIVHKISYLLTLICTILFAAIVNMFMRRSIAQIHMAESLKAVE